MSNITQQISRLKIVPSKHFQDQQLDEFIGRILAMLANVRMLMKMGRNIIEDKTDAEELAKKAKELRHSTIAAQDSNVETIVRLLALQQPLETDFRLLVSGLKISNDIQRMSNQARNIVDGFIRMKGNPEDDIRDNFHKMFDVVDTMLTGSISAFLTIDLAMAEKVVQRDDKVDSLNLSLIRYLVHRAEQLPEEADSYITQVLIIRNLERIGDFCTNVAEEVISYAKGAIIK